MEPTNQFILFFYNLFISEKLKNEFFINKIFKNLEYLFLIIENNFFLIFSITTIFIFIIYLNFKKKKNYNLLFVLNTLIFLIILILFPLNIPFTDSYNEIKLLLNEDISAYFLGRTDEGFLFMIFRLLHIIIFKFFSLNYLIIIYFNLILFILSFCLFIKYLKDIKLDNYILFFILIYFNGKWFVHFYEPVNIVWTINFCLTVLFVVVLNIKNTFTKNFLLLFIYSFALINFKVGIILIIYSVIYGIVLNQNIKQRIFALITPLILYLLINTFLVDSYLIENSISQSSTISSKIIFHYINDLTTNYFSILGNFLASHTLIFDPLIFPIKYFSIIFVLVQYFYLFYLCFFNKKNFFNNLRNFIINNPFIIIGSLGCFLITLFREDYIHSRYMTFSLLFQLGFFIFYFKNDLFKKNISIFKNNLLVFLFLIIYFVNIFITNQGFFFALKKNYVYNNVKNCLISKQDNNECLPDMFYQTFYDNNEKHYEVFKEDIYMLKKLNLTIFREIHNK